MSTRIAKAALAKADAKTVDGIPYEGCEDGIGGERDWLMDHGQPSGQVSTPSSSSNHRPDQVILIQLRNDPRTTRDDKNMGRNRGDRLDAESHADIQPSDARDLAGANRCTSNLLGSKWSRLDAYRASVAGSLTSSRSF